MLSLTTLRSILLLIVFVLLALPATAVAHERRTLAGGKYDVVVGWDVEPAYQGLKNGATIRISQGGSNPAVPVEGADKTLKVQIRQGAQTKEFALAALENLDSQVAAREARPLLKSEAHLPFKLRLARLLARHGFADGYALATEHLADVAHTAGATLAELELEVCPA